MIEIQDYIKTDWQPNIVDPFTGETVSEGTRFTSKRANNFEEGIWTNRELHKKVADKIKRLEVELEIIGRVPGGNSFFDILEEGEELSNMSIEDVKAYATNTVNSTKIILSSTKGFEVGEEYVIYDDEHVGVVSVKNISQNTLEIKELDQSYKKGAILTKDMGLTQDGLKFTGFSTYSVKGRVI